MGTKNIRVVDSVKEQLDKLKGEYISMSDTIQILIDNHKELMKLKCISADQMQQELQDT